jgi:hypothetical protein
MRSFNQASESILWAPVVELTEDLGHPFQTDNVEQVAYVCLACAATLLIGSLRET